MWGNAERPWGVLRGHVTKREKGRGAGAAAPAPTGSGDVALERGEHLGSRILDAGLAEDELVVHGLELGDALRAALRRDGRSRDDGVRHVGLEFVGGEVAALEALGELVE